MKDVRRRAERRLADRRQNEALRTLPTLGFSHVGADPIDFFSNDYLGLASSEPTEESSERQQTGVGRQAVAPFGSPLGSTGSRLLSGNRPETEALEATLAEFYGFEAGLIFNSGYDANLGLLSSLAGREDSIILDELAHASLIDGARLSDARRYHFRHNDLADLAEKLERIERRNADRDVDGSALVVVESVYSMDGDEAPLTALADLCDAHSASLVVDEAHAVGVFGEAGRGLVAELGLLDRVAACVYTFGKAVGYHGAVVVGQDWLSEYLINFCRPFIYSTAPPPSSISTLATQHARMVEADPQRRRLHDNIDYFCRIATASRFESGDTVTSGRIVELITGRSPIQTLKVPGAGSALHLEQVLQKAGFAVKAIRSPTVAVGQERIRICLHSYNTETEIDALFEALDEQASPGLHS